MNDPSPDFLTREILAVLDRPAASAEAQFEPPLPDEYDAYYGRYISKVPPGDFRRYLRRQVEEVTSFFGAFSPAQADFSYAPGKWTIKEVLGHVTDTERVFCYRALSIGRLDTNPLPGFDQDVWMPPAEFGRRSLAELITEWVVVRASTLTLAEGFPPSAALRRGWASEKGFSVRALLYVPAGHINYHLEILRERYLASSSWPA